MIDFAGKPLQVGDEVVFSYYRGDGTLLKGKIEKVTEKQVIIQPYWRSRAADGSIYYRTDVPYKRKVSKHLSELYLLKL